MKIRAEEISNIIQKQVENFDKKATKSEVGTVLELETELPVFMA